jgi:hypothetical protein
VDPILFNANLDLAFKVSADPDPGFQGPKIEEKIQQKQKNSFFIKNCFLLIRTLL